MQEKKPAIKETLLECFCGEVWSSEVRVAGDGTGHGVTRWYEAVTPCPKCGSNKNIVRFLV